MEIAIVPRSFVAIIDFWEVPVGNMRFAVVIEFDHDLGRVPVGEVFPERTQAIIEIIELFPATFDED